MRTSTYRKLIRELSPEVARAFERAMGELAGRIDWKRFMRAVEAGDVDRAVRILNIDPGAFHEVRNALERAFRRGGQAEIAAVPVPSTATFTVAFSLGNPRAERIALLLGSTRIREIIDDTRDIARERITAGINAGRNPTVIARTIVGVSVPGATGHRTGGILGLTRAQAGWADAAYAELSATPPDARYFRRKRRDRRFDSAVRKAIREGKPLPYAMRHRIARLYRSRLLKLRGDTIARTETGAALNGGRYEAMEQLIEAGTTTADLVTLEWSDSRDLRVRDLHTAMNGQQRKFGQPFQSPNGALLRYPGDIMLGAGAEDVVNCRCALITTVDWIEQYARGLT